MPRLLLCTPKKVQCDKLDEKHLFHEQYTELYLFQRKMLSIPLLFEAINKIESFLSHKKLH
jgi:hypothetical protein